MSGIEASDGAAPPVRPLRPGEPPLAILVDYDGTIAQTDVSDTVMATHVPGIWETEAAAYDAGLMGSRRLMTWEMAQVDADPAALLAEDVDRAAMGIDDLSHQCQPNACTAGALGVEHVVDALALVGVIHWTNC